MILISACLLGRNVKYSGGNNLCPWLAKYYNTDDFIAICPECFGVLPIPRPPAEIQGGSGEDVLNGTATVADKDGKDVTQNFINGAQKALAYAKKHNANCAILKARSPSCGCGMIYDGTFSGGKKAGNGVTAALFLQHGIKVYTEESITEEELIKILKEK